MEKTEDKSIWSMCNRCTLVLTSEEVEVDEQVPAGHPFSPWSVAKMGGAFVKTDFLRESSH